MGTKPKTIWRRVTRLVQRATGIHRIHDIRYSYGWKLPFTSWAYFPAFTVRDGTPTGRWTPAQWQRVQPSTYHDCTKTGVY